MGSEVLAKYSVAPWGGFGQMQLVATENIEKGSVIFSESPLAWCPVMKCKYSSLQWGLVECLMSNNKVRRELFNLKLHNGGVVGYGEDDHMVARELSERYKTKLQNIMNLYAVVCTNNIGTNDVNGNKLGYGIYPSLSRSNHSCVPSAVLNGNGDVDNPVITVLAVQDIQPGEAVTWQYLDFEKQSNCADPLKDFHVRNWLLADSFGFACQCDLCLQQLPEELRGRDVYQIYHNLIIDNTKKLTEMLKSAWLRRETFEMPDLHSVPPSPWS